MKGKLLAKTNIMIIEDEAIIAKDIENILLNNGYNITGIFSKAEDAIISLNDKKPDLILMDIVLKGDLDGIEAANIIKETMSIPVIFVTAYADETTISRIKKVNPYGYFLKPFEEKELHTWIETTLEKFHIEEEMKRNERIAVSVLNGLDEAFITIDCSGLIKLMNKSAEKLAGISFNDARQKTLYDIFKGGNLKDKLNAFSSYKTPHEIQHYKTTLENHKKEILNIDYKIFPISKNGAIDGYAILLNIDNSVINDELHKLTIKLNESHKELEKFAYIASHDLQEPLRMTASYVQLLKKRYEGKLDSQADDFIEYAVEGVNRMRKLIEDLLLYSRISSRKLKYEDIDCNEVIAGVEKSIHKHYKLAEHSVKYSNLPIIYADKYQIQHLFYHLIENSVKFNTQNEPRAEISCEIDNNKAYFSITDNGIGIEYQYIDKIFEAFQKLHHHKEYPGTGIGLTICKKIVELHGGKINVESEPGKGTTFSFDIPVVKN